MKLSTKRKIRLEARYSIEADEFAKNVVDAKNPMKVVDLFYKNEYLKRDLEMGGKIFYKALDLTSETIKYSSSNQDLRTHLFAFAYINLCKKKNIVNGLEADKTGEVYLNKYYK